MNRSAGRDSKPRRVQRLFSTRPPTSSLSPISHAATPIALVRGLRIAHALPVLSSSSSPFCRDSRYPRGAYCFCATTGGDPWLCSPAAVQHFMPHPRNLTSAANASWEEVAGDLHSECGLLVASVAQPSESGFRPSLGPWRTPSSRPASSSGASASASSLGPLYATHQLHLSSLVPTSHPPVTLAASSTSRFRLAITSSHARRRRNH